MNQQQTQITLDYIHMYDYNTIKTELQRRRNKTRHFTRAFLKIFSQAQQDAQHNRINNVDDYYMIPGEHDQPGEPPRILVSHAFDAVRQTAFYRIESGSYCEFLCIAYQIERKAEEKARREAAA